MRFLSLFAGIGGFDLGLEKAGHRCVGQVEIDGFCQRVLAARWPREWRAEDVRGCFSSPMSGPSSDDGGSGIDLLCGGFPCQDLSVAGKRAGLSGSRSGLFWEIVRIAKEVRPPWGLFENVPGLLSSRGGRDFWLVLQGLRECWPAVGYRILDSQHFGVAQRRRRVFLVCGPTEAGVREVLFEPEGGGGNPETGGEAAAALTARTGKGPGSDCLDGAIVIHSLTGEGHDASEDGTGRGTPLVIRSNQTGANGIGVSNSAYSLQSTGGADAVMAKGIRRLTPLECERLQGFPDGWTCLCGTEDHEMGCKCPDSPRYRALGNAVTVNVVEWIGRRLLC